MSALALITGASSGIGRAYATRLAAAGHDLVIVARREHRLRDLAASLSPQVDVQIVVADLATDDGIDDVAAVCAERPLTMLINNAGIGHYMPITELSVEQARELLYVKVVAPALLTRAAAIGMKSRGDGTVVNVAGMLAFSGPADASKPGRALYAGTLALAVASSQTLSVELEGDGLRFQVVCPGIVATEFHTVQGMDLSAFPRMSADDVVSASLRGLELGEVVCAPGLEDAGLLTTVFEAQLAAFAGQSPDLASRYRES
ncbi:SDR family NAD(P)-dependent oxidoreductase [Mycolicibacterium sp. GCM10028919]|uniref:SDR family NAD(P)-dependent oxidoreductase n=1 Tax=Mycolicibacterium sp. GCM10028919 TaxID=3273401 RepID=UPI0036090876